jgi:TRAP-type C4-dicarboxylate transport system permease small subunit
MAREGTIADRMNRARSMLLVVACMVLSIALCVWGTIGWRRAYRAQAEVDNLAGAEQFRDAQLLRIVVRGGEAAAQLALEGMSEAVPAAVGGE